MATGIVKWLNDAKGYGFILPDEGRDLFVHYCGIADGGFRTRQEGAQVEFEVREGRQGLEAFNVRPVGGTAPVRASGGEPAMPKRGFSLPGRRLATKRPR